VKPVALYGGAGIGLGLLGYGIYTALSNVTSGGQTGSQTIAGCQAQWQNAFQAYTQQYQAYVKANKGGALTQQQLGALQPYIDIMNSAENCMTTVSNASSTTFANAITEAVLAVAAVAGIVAGFRAYLNYKKGGGGPATITSGSEARSVARSSVAQAEVDAGEISSFDASGLVSQSRSVGESEASAESTAVGGAADSVLSKATASGDESIVEQAQEFLSTIIDTVVEYVTATYDYFATLV
jgi:hypothetical protein